MALEAKKRGVFVVCLTNVKYSESVSSRRSCGKRLFEVCSPVLDNCGDIGDAAVSFEGFAQKSGPTSTEAGAAILNAVVAEVYMLWAVCADTAEKLVAKGLSHSVYKSVNFPGGPEEVKRIDERYTELGY